MQQVRCIKPFGQFDVGDVSEVPDGAAVDPVHWEPVTAVTGTPPGADAAPLTEAPRPAVAPPAKPVTPAKEEM